MKSVFSDNDQLALNIRDKLTLTKTNMINIIGSPGCGKTSILEYTIPELQSDFRQAVIEGDMATDKDARRLQKYDIPIIMVNTEGGCHLNAASIQKALNQLDLNRIDVIFVENVGNLVCPAHFDIGENMKIAVVSTTEGDDKPSKYPLLFHHADAVILNKTDLIPYTNFNEMSFWKDIDSLNPKITKFNISCTSKEKNTDWLNWIKKNNHI